MRSIPIGVSVAPACVLLALLCNCVSPAWAALWMCVVWFAFVLLVQVGDRP